MRWIVLITLISLFSCSKPERVSFEESKNPRIIQLEPKKPVRIILRKSQKGRYSWELRGDDIDEILSVERKLREEYEVVNNETQKRKKSRSEGSKDR